MRAGVGSCPPLPDLFPASALFPALLPPASPLLSLQGRSLPLVATFRDARGRQSGTGDSGLDPVGTPGGIPFPSTGLTFLIGKVKYMEQISDCKLCTGKGHFACFPVLPPQMSYHFGGFCLSSSLSLLNNDEFIFLAFVLQSILSSK